MLLSAFVLVASASGTARADEVGGNRLEVGLLAGRMDFDDAIRFRNDTVVGVQALAGVSRWFSLGMELSRITARDRLRGEWQDITFVSLRGRIEPWADGRRVSAGAVIGVSFMAFEDAPSLDAISEGFDLGAGARVELGEGWLARADLLLRLQTFNLVQVDSDGIPTGQPEETGYLWSRLFLLGVSRAF